MSEPLLAARDEFLSLCRGVPTYAASRAALYEPQVVLRPERVHVADSARVDAFVKIEGGEGVYIGPRVHVASFCHVGIGGGTLILDEGAALASGAKVVTGSNVPAPGRSCSAVDPSGVIRKTTVRIGRNAVIFSNAIVLPGVTVGDGAVVAAGSVVNRDVPAGETWAGVPARRVKPAPETAPRSLESAQSRHDRYREALAEFYGWER